MSVIEIYRQLALLPCGSKPLGSEHSAPDDEDANDNREGCEDESAKPVRIEHTLSPQERGQSHANRSHACNSGDDAGQRVLWVKSEKRLLPHTNDYDRAELRVPHVTFVGNRGSDEGVYNLKVTFGWYWDEGRFGVYVETPDFGMPHFAQFRMPNANISELLKFVRESREWLNTHP